jgi:hypothetical protein
MKHLSERMEDEERDPVYETFLAFAGTRLCALQQDLNEELSTHPGGYQGQADPKGIAKVEGRLRQVGFAVKENGALAGLLAMIHDIAHTPPVDGLHARKMLNDIRAQFLKFAEDQE